MAHWKDAAVTNAGVELLNEWMAGRRLTITSAYGGTGTVDASLLAGQTGLANQKQKLSLMGQEEGSAGVVVQVQVNNTGVTEEYELNQVAVYAALDRDKNPDSEEVLLFLMQDEKGADIPAEDDEFFVLELYCAIGITNNGRFAVTVDNTGLVSLTRMQEAVAGAVAAHSADLGAHAEAIKATVQSMVESGELAAGGSRAAPVEITIPADGWTDVGGAEDEADGETDSSESGGLYLDIAMEGVTEDMIPLLSIYQADLETARQCGFSTSVRTLEGVIRVYAQTAPSAAIRATLALLGTGGAASSGGGSCTMPVATDETLGAVKVGNGLSITKDGTLSVDAQTVMTEEDLVDEAEVQKSVATILNKDEA